MIIGIDSDMHVTYGEWQEVGYNIKEVFFIFLPSQKMTLQLNNIRTFIRHFYFLERRHFPLLVLSVVKQFLDGHLPRRGPFFRLKN
jgi:hypothetical protein